MRNAVQLVKEYGTAAERKQAGAVLRFLDTIVQHPQRLFVHYDRETGQDTFDLAGYCETLGLVEKHYPNRTGNSPGPWALRLTNAGRDLYLQDGGPSYLVVMTGEQRLRYGGRRIRAKDGKRKKPLSDYLVALGDRLFAAHDINGDQNSAGLYSITAEDAAALRDRVAALFSIPKTAFEIRQERETVQ